jgi:hypothetical protein
VAKKWERKGQKVHPLQLILDVQHKLYVKNRGKNNNER